MATMTNTNDENFGNLVGANVTVTHFSVIYNYGQGNEQLAFTSPLVTPRSFVAGDPLEFPAGSLVGTIPNGGYEGAFLKGMMDAWNTARGVPTVVIGTGAMGENGKANELTAQQGYTRQLMEFTTAA